AGAMTRLLTDHELRQRFAENGIVRARELFTWQQVGESVEALYREVAGTRSARADIEVERHRVVTRGVDDLMAGPEAGRAQNVGGTLALARIIADCFAQGRKLVVCGNGGSAADAQHLAGELVARFRSPQRRGLPVIVLGAELSSLTAWANDVDYES